MALQHDTSFPSLLPSFIGHFCRIRVYRSSERALGRQLLGSTFRQVRDCEIEIEIPPKLIFGFRQRRTEGKEKKISEGEVIKVTRHLLSAASHLHSCGVILLRLCPCSVTVNYTQSLSNQTRVEGMPWTELKRYAMGPGFTSSERFVSKNLPLTLNTVE